MLGERYIDADCYLDGSDAADNETMYSGYDNDNFRTVRFTPMQDTSGLTNWEMFGSAHASIVGQKEQTPMEKITLAAITVQSVSAALSQSRPAPLSAADASRIAVGRARRPRGAGEVPHHRRQQAIDCQVSNVVASPSPER